MQPSFSLGFLPSSEVYSTDIRSQHFTRWSQKARKKVTYISTLSYNLIRFNFRCTVLQCQSFSARKLQFTAQQKKCITPEQNFTWITLLSDHDSEIATLASGASRD